MQKPIYEMRRILVVDDNEDILEILRLILEGYDYEVATLADGHFLTNQVKDYKPDLILLDIMLGDMDGRELCKILKSNTQTHDIPVILISASHGMSERFMPCDAPDDFLAKPFDISELMAKVHTHLSAA